MTVRNIGEIPPHIRLGERFQALWADSTRLSKRARALPENLRLCIRPLLPERAFLRRARGDGLFITDAPRHSDEDIAPSLSAMGFLCTLERGCLLIAPGAEHLLGFEMDSPSPPDFFCETLLRFRGEPPCEAALNLFAQGVRLLEKATEDEIRIYQRRARNLAALCLRNHWGGAYACALIAHVLEN